MPLIDVPLTAVTQKIVSEPFESESLSESLNALASAAAQTAAIAVDNPAVEKLRDRWEQLRPQVTQAATQAAETSQTVARETFDRTLQQASEQLQSSLNSEPLRPLSDGVKSGIAQGLETADNANAALASKAQTFLSAPLQQWLAAHPLWQWGLEHPLVAIAAFFVGLILLFNLLKLVFSLRIWLWLLGLPVRLIARLMTPKASKAGALPKASPSAANTSTPMAALASAQGDHQSEINRIMARLQVLQDEQKELHDQLKTLLLNSTSKR